MTAPDDEQERKREKQREASRKWHAKNRDYVKAKWRERYARDGKAMNEKNREYRRKNPEKVRATRLKNYQKVMATNPDYFRERQREWRRKNPEQARNHKLRSNYGISQGDYDRILHEQGGVCAICRKSDAALKYGKFCVDHNHTTGAIRGLLCWTCNVGIGALRDCPVTLRAAADYLDYYQARRKTA